MACLRDPNAELATGDAIYCSECQGILNKFSNISMQEEGKQVWTCEFCNNQNQVDIEADEKPKSETVNFMIEAPAQVKQEEEESKTVGKLQSG